MNNNRLLRKKINKKYHGKIRKVWRYNAMNKV
jgi:hypothetical protein